MTSRTFLVVYISLLLSCCNNDCFCTGNETVKNLRSRNPERIITKEENENFNRKLIDARIVGGNQVEEHNELAYEFVASLQRQSFLGSHFNWFCGGSLIHENWILTAAHCVGSSNPDRVVVGSLDLSKAGEENIRYVEETIIASNYNKEKQRHDIALMRLSSPVKGIRPVQLNNEFLNEYEKDGRLLNVAGWGYLSEGSWGRPEKLQQVDVPVQSNSKCKKKYEGILWGNICAGYDTSGRDSCAKDSGGPLFDPMSNTLVGVVSYGFGCARAGYYGVYSRVSRYTTFIETTLNKYGDTLSGNSDWDSESIDEKNEETPGTKCSDIQRRNTCQDQPTCVWDSPAPGLRKSCFSLLKEVFPPAAPNPDSVSVLSYGCTLDTFKEAETICNDKDLAVCSLKQLRKGVEVYSSFSVCDDETAEVSFWTSSECQKGGFWALVQNGSNMKKKCIIGSRLESEKHAVKCCSK